MCPTEYLSKVLNAMRFKINKGIKNNSIRATPRSQTENRTNKFNKRWKSFLSNWSELSVSAERRPKIPINVSRNSDGEVSNHIVKARTKTEEKAMTEKSPNKKTSVSEYSFKFFEKNHNKKSLEGRFQRKIQTAVS